MKLLTILLSILLLTSFISKDEVHISFPNKLGVVQTCNGEEVEILIEISTESLKKINVHSFSLDKSDFTIFNHKKAHTVSDTLTLSKKNPLMLKVKYKLQASYKPTTFTFKTDIDKYSNNQIKLNYGEYFITTRNIREREEQFINVSENCQDSIKVFFPYGGSISGATLYTDSTSTQKAIKSVSYGIMEEGNFMTFTKADVGRYFVDFGSCHWGGEFWLTVK